MNLHRSMLDGVIGIKHDFFNGWALKKKKQNDDMQTTIGWS